MGASTTVDARHRMAQTLGIARSSKPYLRMSLALWRNGARIWRARKLLGNRVTRIPGHQNLVWEASTRQHQQKGKCHPVESALWTQDIGVDMEQTKARRTVLYN